LLTFNQVVKFAMNIETISYEALLLPPQERAQLAEQLLCSLDTLTETEVEQLWFQEAARRADEMDRGLVQRIPADVVNREAQALLR
jgi:putative addiction module component (TIGR02574 family)